MMKWFSFLAVVALLIAGWALYNSATNPPIAEAPVSPSVVTPTPPAPSVVTPTPTPPVAPPVLPVVLTPPTILKDFVVPDELWQNAFRINLADGSPLRGTVGFSNLPVGTELRAPLDGYIDEGGVTFPGGERVPSFQWTERQRSFNEMWETKIAFNISGAEIVNHAPRKGEVFARVTSNTPIGVGFHDREVVFMIMVAPADFEFQTDRSITDPKTYIQKAIEKLN